LINNRDIEQINIYETTGEVCQEGRTKPEGGTKTGYGTTSTTKGKITGGKNTLYNQKSSPSPVPYPRSKVIMSPRCISCSGRKHRLPGEPVISVMEKFAVVGETFPAEDIDR
jgi:hypothetical protein